MHRKSNMKYSMIPASIDRERVDPSNPRLINVLSITFVFLLILGRGSDLNLVARTRTFYGRCKVRVFDSLEFGLFWKEIPFTASQVPSIIPKSILPRKAFEKQL